MRGIILLIFGVFLRLWTRFDSIATVSNGVSNNNVVHYVRQWGSLKHLLYGCDYFRHNHDKWKKYSDKKRGIHRCLKFVINSYNLITNRPVIKIQIPI